LRSLPTVDLRLSWREDIPAVGRAQRSLRAATRLARIAAPLAPLILAACSLGSGTPAAHGSPSPTETGGGSSVAQDLTLSGKLPARWTEASATCGTADGKGSDSFSVTLTAADALGQMDTLTIVVGSGYKGVGEYSLDTTTTLATAASGNTTTPVAASTPQLVTTFVVQVDRATGTIDSQMGHGADSFDAIERVAGTWRCK
jgi:hypothetical protein